MVGLTTAVALAQSGLKVCVIDALDPARQQDAKADGRVSALAYGSRVLLENLGIWSHLEPHAQPIYDIRVVDEGSPVSIHYDHQQVGDEPMGHIAENRHIRGAIAAQAASMGAIKMIAPAKWQAIEEDSHGVTITLQDGRRIYSELLLAADGKFSLIRTHKQMEVLDFDYRQTALVATIEHELPHNGLALERFREVGPFAVLPMLGNASSLVWVEQTRHAELYAKLDKVTLEGQIQQRVGEYLGRISLAGSLHHYPLSLKLAKDYVCDRVALVGDAAHGIHPIAGQGVNLGFRDVALLAEIIVRQAKRGLDLAAPDALQHYADRRRSDALLMASVTDGINRLFSNGNPVLKLARNMGFYAVEHNRQLKKHFMLQAMGIEGELPPLMQKSHKVKNAA